MKTFKILAISVIALLSAGLCHAQTSTTASSSSLTSSNGIAAGKAIVALYTQYKADGKLDLANTANVTNLVSLATNIAGLATNNSTTDFLSGLVSGSKSLVNSENSSSVLSTLKSISGLDLSSLGTAAATSAASSLLGKFTGTKTSGSATSSSAANSAASALTSLFKTLGE